MKFINRKSELRFLEDHFKSGKAELIVIYGRRRIGKTELLLQFAKEKPHIYFLTSETSEKENLQELFNRLHEFFKDEITIEKTWDNLFKYLANKKRFILIIDEFPYLIAQNKAIPSLFQKGWDLYLKDSKIFLVLAGSSMGMMEEYTLLYKSPLYGRRTGQWKVEPLKFSELFNFFQHYSLENLIGVYGALDSIPAYIVKFNPQSDFWENVKQNHLAKGSFLYDETDFLLKQELREPKIYKNILKAIALGNTKFSEIMNSTGMDKSKLFVYLDILESLGIIEKRIPVLDKLKSKKGRYFIKDNFFKFWFRYILPNKSSIEEGNVDIVIKKIKSDYNNYLGRFVFESVCKSFLRSVTDQLPFNPETIGSQWGTYRDKGITKSYEIDIVGINEQTREILFAECKWQNKKIGLKELDELKEKAKLVDWHIDKREEYFAFFSKSGFKTDIKDKNVLLFNLKDMERVFKQKLSLKRYSIR